MRWSFGAALVIVAAVSFARPAVAAVDAFMQIDGIKGESQDDKHKDWIEVSSLNNPTTVGSSTSGAGAGRNLVRSTARPTSGGEITVTKYQDVASPKLYEALHNGTHIPKVTIELARPTGKSPTVYMRYELSDVMISGYQTGSGGDRPSETVTFKYGKLDVSYQPQSPSGSEAVERGAMVPRATHLPPPGDAN